jgi:hypothetical protein
MRNFIFLNYIITFSRSSKRRKRKYQQKSFLKHTIDLSLDFFSKIMRYVFIWVFPDFLDTVYKVAYSKFEKQAGLDNHL